MTNPISVPPTRAMPLQQIDALIGAGVVYALLDSAGSPAVEAMMQRTARERALSLYAGTQHEGYTSVAPYLTHLDADMFRWIHATLWKEPWGIFVFSRLPFAEVCLHLQRFLYAQLPDGTVNFFRFYDPRILQTFVTSEIAPRIGLWNGIEPSGGPKATALKRCSNLKVCRIFRRGSRGTEWSLRLNSRMPCSASR